MWTKKKKKMKQSTQSIRGEFVNCVAYTVLRTIRTHLFKEKKKHKKKPRKKRTRNNKMGCNRKRERRKTHKYATKKYKQPKNQMCELILNRCNCKSPTRQPSTGIFSLNSPFQWAVQCTHTVFQRWMAVKQTTTLTRDSKKKQKNKNIRRAFY